MEEVLVQPPHGLRIWSIVYNHPSRTYGETQFYVVSKEEPSEEALIEYVEECLGEEFDEDDESFDEPELLPLFFIRLTEEPEEDDVRTEV